MSKRKAPHSGRKPGKTHGRQPSSAEDRSDRPGERKGDRRGGDKPRPTAEWLFGFHAVEAALKNPERTCKRLLATDGAAETLAAALARTPHAIGPEIVARERIDDLLPDGAVHQGVAMHVAPLPQLHVEDVIRTHADRDHATIALVDQGTDPRNVGAILRSAAAFGVAAVIVQDRHAPEATGVLAKAASGALESVPMVRATNLARTLDQLKEAGFWTVGLDGTAEEGIDTFDWPAKTVIVLGAEGKGMRRLVRESCDFLVRIRMTHAMESLNLSNAAAIAFHETFRRRAG